MDFTLVGTAVFIEGLPVSSEPIVAFSRRKRIGEGVGSDANAAVFTSREIAIERMQSEAASAIAEGVVGVDMHEGSHRRQSQVIEFFAIGTAVLPLSNDIAPDRIADPIMVLAVND